MAMLVGRVDLPQAMQTLIMPLCHKLQYCPTSLKLWDLSGARHHHANNQAIGWEGSSSPSLPLYDTHEKTHVPCKAGWNEWVEQWISGQRPLPSNRSELRGIDCSQRQIPGVWRVVLRPCEGMACHLNSSVVDLDRLA